jgi:hypothetical protein
MYEMNMGNVMNVMNVIACNLFLYLELAGFYNLAGFVFELVNVNSPAIGGKIYPCFHSHILKVDHFFPQKIIYLETRIFLHGSLKLDIDIGSGGVGVELNVTGNRRRLRSLHGPVLGQSCKV